MTAVAVTDDDAPAGPSYEELPVPPPLDRWIRCIWFLRGETDGAEQIIVPDGQSEVVLHFGEPFAEVDAHGRARTQSRAVAAGQISRPLRLLPGRAADVVGIRFRPFGARAVLGVAQHELTDTIVSLRDLAPRLESALIDAAARPAPAAGRVAAIGRVLATHRTTTPDAVVEQAARLIESGETPRIAAIARQLRVSARSLERRVRDEVGLAPRELRAILRFRRAFQLLSATPAGRWGRIAAQAGYFDQAHLIRDFRRFAGRSPSQFFGAEAQLARAILGE